jgi:hypothetical protein
MANKLRHAALTCGGPCGGGRGVGGGLRYEALTCGGPGGDRGLQQKVLKCGGPRGRGGRGVATRSAHVQTRADDTQRTGVGRGLGA